MIGGTFTGDDTIYAIGVDSTGNVYACGRTESSSLPITSGAFDDTLNGSYDIFLAKFDSTLSDLLYCTYLGGDDYENLGAAIVYPNGSVLLIGSSKSSDFPTTSGAFCETFNGESDVVLTQMNSQGTDIEYSSFIGGTAYDSAGNLALDTQGRAHIVGSTRSFDFPVTVGANKTVLSGGQDAFALRFDARRSELEFSTYLGGNGWDNGGSAVLRNDGSLVINGYTDGQFPTTPGAYASSFIDDGQYVLQLDPTGSRIDYASLCPDTSGMEMYTDLEVRPNGDIILTGFTNSSEFPTTPDAIRTIFDGDNEAFISVLSDGATNLSYSTFIGGNATDIGYALDLDATGELLAMTGFTSSWNLPVTEGAFDITYRDAYDYGDAYLCVVNLTNKSIDYMTYIGGDLGDRSGFVWYAPNGHIFVGGQTDSKYFYTSIGAYQSERLSGQEGFVYEINPVPGHLPGAPSGLTDATTEDQVFLNWGKPDRDGGCRILGYNVYRADAATDWAHKQYHSNRTFDDRDVKNGIQYRYRVAAVNHLGEGSFAELTTTVPVIPPSEPIDVEVSTGNASVTINWTPPFNLGGGKINAYIVYRGPTRNELEVLGGVGNVTTYVDNTAILGEFVYYAVAGKNSGGVGPISTAQRIKPVGPPGTPSSFKAIAADGQVTLSWGAPGSDGGSMLIGFHVYRGTSLGDVERIATLVVTQLSLKDTGVVNGVQYLYYLTAFTDVGESGPTNALDVTPYGLPGFIEDLQANVNDGQVTLEWSPPSSDGGRQITKYKIYVGEGSAGSIIYLTQIGNVTQFDHTGLTNGVTYFYHVTAVNEAGEGQISETVSAKPMGLPSSVRDLTAEAIRAGIRLTWKPPEDQGGAETVKIWLYRGDPDSPQLENYIIGAVEFLDTNVSAGSTYEYWARTETSFGFGNLVGPVEVTAVTVPGIVRNLETASGDGKVYLTWTTPEEDGGSPIVEYIVKRGIFVTGIVEVARTTVLNHTDTGLDNGKEYLYVVVAVTAVGTGTEIEPIQGIPLGPPGAPGLFKGEAKGQKVVLTWAKPSGSDRAPVTGYRLERALGDGEFIEIAQLGEVITYTDDDVKEGKRYTYRISSLSEIGEGIDSSNVEIKVNKKDEEPGFGLYLVVLAIMGAIMFHQFRSRRN